MNGDAHYKYQDREAAYHHESIVQPETNESVRHHRSQYRDRKEFLSSNALQVVGPSASRQKERQVIGIDLDQENRGEGHDDIHNSDEDRDIGAQPRNHVGKDIIAIV